jgi:exopolysaccharide production protein ExoZ
MPAPAGIAPEGRHLPGLQVLRALAALAVVWFHAGRYLADQIPHAWWRWGEFGVDVFFVLSGFVMVHATRDRTRVRDFLAARVARIVPLYWAATLAMALLVWWLPQLFVAAQLTSAHLVQSLAFWPHFSPSMPGQVMPLLVPGWTLVHEMYFYLLFGLLLPLRPALRVAMATLLLSLGVLLAPRMSDSADSAWAHFLGAPLMLEFAFGMMTGLAYRRGWRPSRTLAWLAGFAGTALVVGTSQPELRVWSAGVGGLALLVSASNWQAGGAPSFALLHRLGDASYSTYLLHPFVLGALFLPLLRVPLLDQGVAGVAALSLLALLASATAGLLCHHWIERPLTRIARRSFALPLPVTAARETERCAPRAGEREHPARRV